MQGEYLILWGGTDINPLIYGEFPHRLTDTPDNPRDLKEISLYKQAVMDGIPVIGVCRGAQLLCALNGGSLWQHTPDHNYSHDVKTTTGDGVLKTPQAGHHQVMRPSGNYELLAYCEGDTTVVGTDDVIEVVKDTAEVVYYPDTKSIAIQPHPEWMARSHSFNVWLDKIIKERLNVEVDFWEGEQVC